MRSNPTVSIKASGRIEIKIHSLADALEVQRNLNESITQAIQDGKWGAQNGIDCDGDSHHIRFQVEVGSSEQTSMGYAAGLRPPTP